MGQQSDRDEQRTADTKVVTELQREDGCGTVHQIAWGDLGICIYIEDGIETILIGETEHRLNVERINGGMLKITHRGPKDESTEEPSREKLLKLVQEGQ